MLTSYIVDDEPHALNILADYIKRSPDITLVGKSNSAVTALDEIIALQPDVAFLDIEMPEISGISLSELLGNKIFVIFTTAHAKFAVSAFDQGSYDFLLKPIKYERFLKSIEKIKYIDSKVNQPDWSHANKTHVFIPSGFKGCMRRIDLRDIDYIESIGNYLVIYENDQKHIVYLTLKEMIGNLPESFSRIHKSVIINDDKVKSIVGNQVIISEKVKLVVGANFKASFFEKITSKLVKKK